MTLTGLAVCAHTFVRVKIRKGVGAGAGVVVLGAGAVSWLRARV